VASRRPRPGVRSSGRSLGTKVPHLPRAVNDAKDASCTRKTAQGRLGDMTAPAPKTVLQRYLQAAREALVWKLEGLSEYDARRPISTK